MALMCNLFKGDKRLEASQVNDAAHLTLGTQGESVAKVQMALYALDGLLIDRAELRAQTYGRTTARAVLQYKTKRQIINHSYQNTADDIVGKMTITRLDRDMVLWERSQKYQGECSCSPSGKDQRPPAIRHGLVASTPGRIAAANQVGGPKARLPQFNKVLHIYCSITQKASLDSGYPINKHIQQAKDTLFEYGITLSVEFSSIRSAFGDVIQYPGSLVIEDDLALLRKASEDARPGFPKVLRIIVCPRSPNAWPGETFRNVRIGTTVFPPFAVLNSNSVSDDSSTLLHEMIHCAYKGPVDHDTEPSSVFYEYAATKPGSIARNWLKRERAEVLSNGFFAF